MADKQIIIHGVDVSGCEAIDNHSGWCSFWEENCAKNPDCIHKKYLRKEQECETQQKALELQKSFLDHSEWKLKKAEQKLEKIKKIVNTHKRDECVTCSEFDNCLGHPYCDEVILQIIEE